MKYIQYQSLINLEDKQAQFYMYSERETMLIYFLWKFWQ